MVAVLGLGIDQREVLAVGEIGVVADAGELGDAATEGEARAIERELADQQQVDDHLFAGCGGRDLKRGNDADDDGVLGENLGEATDLGAGGGAVDQFDLGEAAGDADDAAELDGSGAQHRGLRRGTSGGGLNRRRLRCRRDCGRGRARRQRRHGCRRYLPDLVQAGPLITGPQYGGGAVKRS